MSGLFVFIGSPPENTTIGRSATVSGSVTGAGSGSLNRATIQFGVGGPTFQLFGRRNRVHVADWHWQGLIPNNIRPGQAFPIIVRSDGEIQTRGEPEPEFEPVDGEGILNVVLENVVPVLTVAPLQTPIVVMQLPHEFDINGDVFELNPAVYGVPQVQYQLDNGPLTNLAALPAQGAWSVRLPPVPRGDHLLTVRAVDAFETVTTVQRTLTVLEFDMPAVVDPSAEQTRAGVPTTSSITSWTRLEPQCSDADIDITTRARVFDPLWMMTRQWQVGEFQAEDAGSPVQARVRATNAPLTRCHFGELSAANASAQGYDPTQAPLEAMVERRRMRAADADDSRMLTLAVEAGLHFLRMLEFDAKAKKYRPAFLVTYTMPALPDQAAASADDATARFVQTMVGRAPDARRLALAFRRTDAAPITFDASLHIAPADVAAVQQVAAAWLDWYDDLFTEPANEADDAWTAPRLEYAVSVSTRLSAQPQDGVTLSASEFDGGRLDWSSFDVNDTFSIDTTGDDRFGALVETTVPSPVTFRGAPAARFWELEDANVAYGLMSAGPTDLVHLLMIEYAGSYGNDWYVVPLTVPVGGVTRVDSLVVTDTFGVRSLLRPIGDPELPPSQFSMWQPSSLRYAGDTAGPPVSNRFFLPPTIGRSIDGTTLEDVQFMRDEMANLAWGIERNIEGAIEAPVSLADAATTASAETPAAPGEPLRYQLATNVPENWVPLLPVQLQPGNAGPMITRLQRGAVLQPDGSNNVTEARSEALNALGSSLLYDEEIPREGVRITRRRRMTRWIDGSTWVWTAFRNEAGRGEGSAGLKFDQLNGNGPQ
jgi:hypothetical protein